MDFNENLRVRYSCLTKQCKRVADFLSAAPDRAVRMTAKAIGDASGTSAAAVVRLCGRLGYGGLEDLKIHLAKSLDAEEMTRPIETMVSPETNVSDLGHILFSNTSQAMQETLALLDYDALRRAVRLLARARTVYVYGVGGSSLAALDLTHNLNRVGRACIYLLDGHTNLEFASIVTKRDAVVAVSYSGETKEVYLAAQGAKNNGAPIIAITRNRPNSLSTLSSIVLPLPESERRVRAAALSTKFSELIMTDLLYLGMIHEDYGAYEELLMNTSRIVRGLRD